MEGSGTPGPPRGPRAAQTQQRLTLGAGAALWVLCSAGLDSQEFTQGWAYPRALCPSCCPSALPICIHTPPLPQAELPAPYGPWMEIAHDLPQLVTSHQLRSRVHQVPVLSLLANQR